MFTIGIFLAALVLRVAGMPANTEGTMQDKTPRMGRQDVAKSQDGLKPALTLPVRWSAPFFNSSGYASEAINFILPIADRLELGISHNSSIWSEPFINDLPPSTRETLHQLQGHNTTINGGIFISHKPGFAFKRPPDAVYHIGRTMFETDRLPTNWVAACNQMDEIWVPSRFNAETFARAGVERPRVKIIPGAVDAQLFNPEHTEPMTLPNPAGYNFLSIFEWSSRKGWDILLAAYLREFSADDDVCLYLRTYLFGHPAQDASEIFKHKIEEHAKTLKLGRKKLPRIELLTERLPMGEFPRLYRAVDCLVAPSRGEGWGRPQHEAMMMGLPVIATNWGGNTEFMTNETAYLIDYELTETANLEPTQTHYRGHLWAEPFEEHLRQLLREVVTNPKAARLMGSRARIHVTKHFSREAVADLVINRLQTIEARLTGTRPITAPQQLPAEKAEGKCTVAWEGSFLDYGSLSHVNRSLTSALRGQPGIEMACIQRTAGAAPEMPDALSNFAQTMMASEARDGTQVTVRHGWPPIWEKPRHGKWVNIQPWEFGVLPAEWVREMEQLDEAWVPTNYVRDCYIDSGVPADKVQVIPNGIDPEIFRPDAPALPIKTEKRYKFLFVGGTIGRKGPDILLNTYLETFTASDDVCLVIKDFGGKTFYAGQTLAEVIEQAQAQPNAPEIVYLDDDLPPEQVAGLYTACDCLVHPYRGEGFGLPVLEAMACGLPVICTGGGSTDDFATDDYAYRLPATRHSTKPWIGQMLLVKEGWLLEPDTDALADRMRWVFKNRDKARAKGRRASAHARSEWTWDRAAEKAQSRIHALAAQAKPAGMIERALKRMRETSEPTITNEFPAMADLLIETTQNAMANKHDIPDEALIAQISKHLEQADFFLQSNNAVAAMGELEKAHKLDEANAEVLAMLGSLRFQACEYEKARELFRSLIELRPADSQAYTQLAMTAFQLEHSDEFESALGLALELDPNNLEALRFLARVNLQEKRFVDAAQGYRDVIELAPEDTASLLALAMCLYQGGERETSRLVYERVLEIEPENAIAKNNLASIAVGEEMASRQMPAAIDQALQAAQIAIEHNRLEEAGLLLQKALKETPDHPVLLEALANLYMAGEAYEDAKPFALRASEVNADNTLNWIRLGLIAYKQNDFELFESALMKALALEPQNPEALRLLGHANLNVGNHAGAIRQYRQILDQHPEDIEVLQALGVCLHHLGEKDEAQATFAKVLELEPKNQIATQNLAASRSDGVAKMKARNGSAKRDDIASAVEPREQVQEIMNPNLELPFETRTQAQFFSNGELQTLVLSAVTRLGSLDEAAQLARAGQHREAAAACLAAIELRPFHPEAWLYLAQIAIDAGDLTYARKALDRAIAIAPQWRTARQLDNFLNEKSELITTDIEWPGLPVEIGKQRLTICMIVKDEEDFIGQALESVKGIAHQIVVVDTGSTDRTVEIAHEHGAEVHEFKWNDHFGDARNHALQFVRGDWVLILDADEELMAGTCDDLRDDLNNARALGLRIPLINRQTAEGGASHVPRLFRNAPGLCFIGRVHEQIFSSVLSAAHRWGMELGLGQATLLHHGYAPEVKSAKDKVGRNLRLLERALEELPGEPALLMNYGLDLFNNGEVEKALEQLKLSAEAMQQMDPKALLPEVRERLVNTYASILLQAEENETLVEFAQSQLVLASGPTASAHYLHGLALIKLNRTTEAIPQLQACLDRAGAPTLAPGCPGVRKAAPHHLLADCLAHDGRAEEAEEHYCHAIIKDSASSGIRHNYAKFLTAQDRAPEAIELLHERLEADATDELLWVLGCSIVNGHLGDQKIADDWTELAMMHYPENVEILNHRAIALLTAGNFNEALTLFEKAALDDDITIAAIYLCRLASGQAGELGMPKNEIAVSKYLTDWYRRLLVHENEDAADQVAARLDSMEAILPTAGKVLRQAVAA